MKWLIFKNYNHMNIKITSLSILFIFLFAFRLNAQTPPNAFNYSAVARNASGQPIANSTIGIQISILKTSTVGITVYRENHAVNTDAFGLFNLIIGAGAVQTGSMSGINWSNDNYYIRVGMDASGGTNFLTMGTTQLLSVPYALYAKSAGTVTNNNDNDTSATNELQVISLKNDTLFLTNGGFVKLPLSKDTSATNELQTLTISNDTIFLSNGGFVKLPVNNNSNLAMPTIVTKAVVGITSNSATLGGIISNTTNNKIMERGIVYSTSPNPILSNDKILLGSGIGNFDTVTSMNFNYPHFLQPNTTYYVRVYAITENNISFYGNEVNFTTSVLTPPTVVTYAATEITSNSATLKGNIIAANGNKIFEAGFVVSLSPNPTVNFQQTNKRVATNVVVLTDTFTYSDGWSTYSSNTPIYCRAYVISENNTIGYGNNIIYTPLSTGQTGPGGGLVFYNKGNNAGGWQYLECAPNDQSAGIPWGCQGTVIGNTQNQLGGGETNTSFIVAGCNESSFAAKICDNLTLGGQSDWFLPSQIELNYMTYNLYEKGIGGISTAIYWSSVEAGQNQANQALPYIFGNPNQSYSLDKTSSYRVRAIRAY
jgi:hypothetical protein